MTAGASEYFANYGVLTMLPTGGSWTAQTVAVVKDISVGFSAEHVGLWGFGDPHRQAVARHTFKIPVKCKFAKFNPTVNTSGASGFWAFGILSPFGASSGGGGGTSTNNAVQLFTVTAEFYSIDGSGPNLLATVSNVYFKNFDLKASEGQWIQIDLDGEGSDVTYTNPGT